ncbi:MAG: hypothetical protein AAGF30_11830 [Pseudomonadota bacterium]
MTFAIRSGGSAGRPMLWAGTLVCAASVAAMAQGTGPVDLRDVTLNETALDGGTFTLNADRSAAFLDCVDCLGPVSVFLKIEPESDAITQPDGLTGDTALEDARAECIRLFAPNCTLDISDRIDAPAVAAHFSFGEPPTHVSELRFGIGSTEIRITSLSRDLAQAERNISEILDQLASQYPDFQP